MVAWHYPVSNTFAVSQALQACVSFTSASPASPLPEGWSTQEKETGQPSGSCIARVSAAGGNGNSRGVLAGTVLRSTGMEINSVHALGEFIVLLG